MADYKSMYCKLFNKVSDIVCELQEIQRICEEMYIETEEKNLVDFRLSESEDDTEENDKSDD